MSYGALGIRPAESSAGAGSKWRYLSSSIDLGWVSVWRRVGKVLMLRASADDFEEAVAGVHASVGRAMTS